MDLRKFVVWTFPSGDARSDLQSANASLDVLPSSGNEVDSLQKGDPMACDVPLVVVHADWLQLWSSHEFTAGRR